MATYYKKIKGKNYDKKLIDAAESSVRGKGDGRISLNDAKKILRSVKDSSDYSDIEKSTMKYIRDHYAFTPEADQWFRSEIRKWAATRVTAVKKAPKAKAAKKASKPKKPAPVASQAEKRAQPPVPYEPREMERPAPAEGPSLARRILQFILVVIIIIVIFLLLLPSTRDSIKSRISRIIGTAEQHKAPEALTPAPEVKKEVPPAETKAPEKPDESGEYYTVQVKDDLISISEKVLGGYARWIDLYNANRDIIKSPTMIFPGQKLKLPETKK